MRSVEAKQEVAHNYAEWLRVVCLKLYTIVWSTLECLLSKDCAYIVLFVGAVGPLEMLATLCCKQASTVASKWKFIHTQLRSQSTYYGNNTTLD